MYYGWYHRTGDSWKYRNGKNRTAKKVRQAGFAVQWTVEQLWRCPFRAERRYQTDGTRVWTEWKPVVWAERTLTGLNVFDDWVDAVARGNYDVPAFCSGYKGLRPADVDSLSFVLTGLPAQEFIMKYRLKTLDVLLRHTDLSPEEVARRSGFGSKNNLYLTCKREWGVSALQRRQQIQQPEDVGRYQL